MREEKLKGEQVMDLEMADLQWSINTWTIWYLRNHMSLIIEDGHITGLEPKPVRYHK